MKLKKTQKVKKNVEKRNYLNCFSCNDNCAINFSGNIDTNANWAKWNTNACRRY